MSQVSPIMTPAQTPLWETSKTTHPHGETRNAVIPARPHVLIVSDRPQVAGRLRSLLLPYKFNVYVSSDPAQVAVIVNRKKLDGVLLDWSPSRSPELIARIRNSPSNRAAIICAVSDESSSQRAAFKSGCNFVADPPISVANIQRLLRVMNGLIVKEHRHYFRCNERVSVALQSPELAGGLVECVNLSETGIALQMRHNLAVDSKLQLKINLLDGKEPLQVEALVRRIENKGTIGLSFTNISVNVLSRLQVWIDEQISTTEKLFLKQNLAYS